ncbi:TPA: restriction endonuclease subunit S [Clostridioides difficile]|nr:restriction endonuclease subunit S [Clostridioides difficile]MDN9159526.1 restriction endonuclease subunit S [Clostridioides difficile]MDN9831398.1 restriction endonuclease subunit S [Clostridioides difficile]HBG1231371.1 restriction endonuclease subunit S [Clostridioides difficile]
MLKVARIGDLGVIYTGNTPSKRKNEYYESNDIMFIKPDIMSFDIEKVNESNEYISEKAREKARIVPKNSLLVSCIGNIGKLAINIKEASFNQQINAIVHNENIISSKYLAYLLKYNQKKLEAIANAPIVPIINKTQFSNFEVYIHENLDIQENIVEVLDKAQELIDKRKEQIEALDELVKSRFIEMFGDPIKNSSGWRIEKLEKISSVGSSKRVFVDELVESGIPFYRGTEIGALSIGNNITPTLFITEEHYNSLKKSTGVPVMGDLLMPSICPDGRIWCVNTEESFYFKDGRVLWIHLEKQYINSVYLKHMLKEKFIRDYNKIASGTTFSELKIFALKALDIMIPPLGLQNQFSDFVKQVDKLKLKMEANLKELEDNFNSLMQKAFKGELFN